MNKRIQKMIYALVKSDKNTLASFAQKYEVSERTIRNDIKAIDALLEENNLSSIKLDRGGVIRTAKDFKKILTTLSPQDYYTYKLSKDERIHITAAMMINATGFITLQTIADHLFVSRRTVIDDLGETKALIRKNDLNVTSHPNKGLLVEGVESVKRKCLYKLSNFEMSDIPSMNETSPMIDIAAGEAIIIRKILNVQCKIHQLYLSDHSFTYIKKYLGIMIARDLHGQYIESQMHVERVHETFAKDILRDISQYFGVQMIMDEVYFLSDLLANCRFVHKVEFDLEDVRIQIIAREFIHKISETLSVSLENDYIFFENLSNHLQSMYASDSSQFKSNVDIDKFVATHPEVERAVNHHLNIFKQYNSRELTQTEITYIIIHVCAALERKKNHEIAFHVILICHAGIGTSQLLLEKLKRHFNFQIIDTLSAHEAEDMTDIDADFIISTVPLSGDIDYVQVSPVFTDEDYLNIGSEIEHLRHKRHLPAAKKIPSLTVSGVMGEISGIIYDELPLDKADHLIRSIRRKLRNYFEQMEHPDEKVLAPYLHQLLTKEHIQLEVEADDWRDAIHKSAEPLVQDGYIDARYINAMIKNVETNGPYIVMGKGFAVPHERIESGSIRVGMNLIRLKHPIAFGLEELDPVTFVCTMSAIDHKTHLRAFFNLVNMFNNEDFYRKLTGAQTSAEAGKIIENFEHSMDQQ
ncbi:BglG family transcription antiterminator [Pseudoramibacter alactolyticus]|uniref:BglG family transcription antiterminator n=1 Tax=Pseudoramibacter alactolyticus TaxID=113287 RepID=UPI00248E5BB0|nr:PTS sugar transporter subunit IIA [Pseudoramibacter alactolyticus]